MSGFRFSDKLNGNKMDLSLCELEEVPVAGLLALPKGTNLDLSCNSLTKIPVGFAQLSHLIVLDLSKNHISELPSNFGDLINLHTLDLFNNDLRKLPISMSRLHRLKWLDIKENPIHETLRNVAGQCESEAQCMSCARNIVSFMKQADLRQEQARAQQKEQAEEREKKRLELERATNERLKKIKQREKELEREKKQLLQEEQEKKMLESGEDIEDTSFLARDHSKSLSETLLSPKTPTATVEAEKSLKSGLCARFFPLLLGLTVLGVVVCVFMSFWCRSNPYHDYCEIYEDVSQQALSVAGQCGSFAMGAFQRVHEFVTDYLEGDSSYW